MTTPRDPTLELLRALARGGPMAELVEALGVSDRTDEDVIRYEDIERLCERVRATPPAIRRWRGDGVLVEIMPDGELRFLRPEEDETS